MKIFVLIFITFSIQAKIKIAISSDNDQLSPTYKEILKNIYLNAVNESPSIQVSPASRALRDFNTGSFQAMGARIKEISEISPRSILIEPAIIDNFVIGIWSIDKKKKVDFNKSIFVGVRGNYLVDYLVKKYKIENVIFSKNLLNSVNILQRKRADFIISSELFLKSNPLYKDIKFLKVHSHKTNIHHIISPELAKYKNKLEAEFKRRKKNGDFSLINLLKNQKAY